MSRLVEINREFYQQFAGSFDQTRQRIQPGVAGLLDVITQGQRVLDLGCGNGELLDTLQQHGFTGEYTGLDFSAEFVELANSRRPEGARAKFLYRDLSDPNWYLGLEGPFDILLSFAVFHHLPPPLPENIFSAAKKLMSPDGIFIHTNWQFLNSPRWRERVQPWELAGVDDKEVGSNDYLLDWRRGGTGYRYVHYFTEEELGEIASNTGYKINRSYYSDGKEGNLALYQIWQPTR